jgi:hypothetical protein
MLSIDFPETRFHDVALEPEAKSRELASNTEVLKEPPLLNRLSLAEPIVVPVNARQAYSDKAISDFLARQNDQRFFLVRLACAFAPPEGEPIKRAWVTINLHAKETGKKSAAVIAMDPASMSDTQKIEHNAKASAALEMVGGTLTIKGGVGTAQPVAKLFMAALGIGQTNVAWEMYETPAMKIGGIYVFTSIIQVPAKQTTSGTVDIQAEIKRLKFGIIPYKSMLGEHPSSKFVCQSKD